MKYGIENYINFFGDFTHGGREPFSKIRHLFKNPKLAARPVGKVGCLQEVLFFFNIDESHPNNWLEKLTLKTMPEA